ncbi:MAG TPA: glycoside hydrolase family 3 N-terminal domain-containing protein, partial [Polyangiaceae bacterium]|nr:glycoside hydrolase family 3 N-terminal domain-containing protein [Polyangiaceae bacterium]
MDSQRLVPTDQQLSPAYLDPELGDEERIDALLTVLTLAEKLACLHANFSIPRLGIRGSSLVEGLHGLALGGPARFGGDAPVATTTYPQAVGIACTWDETALTEVGAVEAYEARYYFHAPQFRTAGLMVRAPSGELTIDPRSARTDENFGEDPYLAGVLAAAFVRGLQGNHARYWMAAAMLRHFRVSASH